MVRSRPYWPRCGPLRCVNGSATTAPQGEPDTQCKEKNETSGEAAEKIVDTFRYVSWKGRGGFGPPRVCDLPGGLRKFHDGGGLCSPKKESGG